MFTLVFWRATLERSISTAAQAGLLSIGQDVFEGLRLDAFRLDWIQLAGFMLGGFILAVLKALAARSFGSPGPGFGNAETLTEKVAAVEAHPAARAEYQAGPAAHVPEGTAVQVIPDEPLGIMRHDRPADTSADTKAEAAYHDPYPGDDLDTKH